MIEDSEDECSMHVDISVILIVANVGIVLNFPEGTMSFMYWNRN